MSIVFKAKTKEKYEEQFLRFLFQNPKMHKKRYLPPKTANIVFLMVNNFFLCVFKNTDQKNICASIVFKAESKPKHEEKPFLGGFLQKPKTHFYGGPKWYFLKVKFHICISAFVL